MLTRLLVLASAIFAVPLGARPGVRGRSPEGSYGGRPGKDGRYIWQTFQYTKIPDFNPTALAPLPGGGFVLLERAFDIVRGVRVRIISDLGSFLHVNTVTPAPQFLKMVPGCYRVPAYRAIADVPGLSDPLSVAVNPADLTPRWATSLRNVLEDGCGVTVPADNQPGNCTSQAPRPLPSES